MAGLLVHVFLILLFCRSVLNQAYAANCSFRCILTPISYGYTIASSKMCWHGKISYDKYVLPRAPTYMTKKCVCMLDNAPLFIKLTGKQAKWISSFGGQSCNLECTGGDFNQPVKCVQKTYDGTYSIDGHIKHPQCG